MFVRRVLVALVLAAFVLPLFAAKRPLNGTIAFASVRDNNRDIYFIQPSGTGETRVTGARASDSEPAWSPDGLRIAFARFADGAPQIHVMNGDGTGLTQLTGGCCDFNVQPAWSPDGRLIAFASNRESASDIFVMEPDGSNPTRLTDDTGREDDPAWSPDGRSIAFACTGRADRDDRDICIMNADGTNIRVLTDQGVADHFDSVPSFSPDGTKIVFARGTVFTNRDRVMVMNVDGSDLHELASGTKGLQSHSETRPMFSPDGRKIVYAADPVIGEEGRIHVMNADGTNDVEITNTDGADDGDPAWQRTFAIESTGVYVPSTGQWLLRASNTAGGPDAVVQLGGLPGDLPAAGDWNGDGRTDLAVFRNGMFVRDLLNPGTVILTNVVSAFDSVAFGQAGDLPVAGDWDGDGIDDVGVFRPGEQGTFLLRVPTHPSFCSFCTIFVTRTIVFGTAGHLPIAGDWDRDGKDDVGVYDPVTGNVFLTADGVKPAFVYSIGVQGGRPLSGDWLGSGRDGIGVFTPSGPAMALATELAAPPDIVFTFNVPAEGLPVAGHWVLASRR